MNEMPNLLTIRDIQQATQLGRTKIYELMRDGELPFIKIGRSVRVRREAFDQWLSLREQQTKSEFFLFP